MITLKKYLELNPNETEEERHLAEFAAKIESRLLEAKKLLRQVLPDYADEAEHLNGCKVFGEITEMDVVMIRDFLANGIGCNGHKWNDGAMVTRRGESWRLEWCECGASRRKPDEQISLPDIVIE